MTTNYRNLHNHTNIVLFKLAQTIQEMNQLDIPYTKALIKQVLELTIKLQKKLLLLKVIGKIKSFERVIELECN